MRQRACMIKMDCLGQLVGRQREHSLRRGIEQHHGQDHTWKKDGGGLVGVESRATCPRSPFVGHMTRPAVRLLGSRTAICKPRLQLLTWGDGKRICDGFRPAKPGYV